jgi:hypothetical protein
MSISALFIRPFSPSHTPDTTLQAAVDISQIADLSGLIDTGKTTIPYPIGCVGNASSRHKDRCARARMIRLKKSLAQHNKCARGDRCRHIPA